MFQDKRRLLLALLLIAILVVPFVSIAQDEPTEIHVWVAFTDFKLDWTEERAEEFNAMYPDYNIVITGHRDYNTAFDATVSAAEEGNPPAVTHFYEAATQDMLDAVNSDGELLFRPIAEATGDHTEINGVPVVFNDIISAAADYYTVDGVLQSMPWNVATAVMFSNMSILEAAGIETIPETWGEVMEACEAIMALEDGPDYCITWPNHGWFFEQAIAQQGADLANDGNGREGRATELFFNSDAVVAYVTWWQQLNEMGYYRYTGIQRDWGGTFNAFETQKVAFLVSTSVAAKYITDITAENFETAASRMPYNEETGYHGNIIGGGTLWLNNGLDEATETGALMFMNWLINPENAAAWHQMTGHIPLTNAAVEYLEGEGWFEENPNTAVAGWQLDLVSTTGAVFGDFVSIRDVFTLSMHNILVNDADIIETLDGVNEEANAMLEEYNLPFASE
jgi:sn-glycerol 3-phosphate transport system substrate-binding protein